MNFSFARHLRLAGGLTAIVGCLFRDFTVAALGWGVLAAGYMFSIQKMERHIEEQEPEEEDEDAVR